MRKINEAAANLFPGYFAVVMATGIVSIAAYLLEMRPVAWTLLIVNLVAYLLLALLLVTRLFRFFQRVVADLSDHSRGPGFFTVIAGTCVLGSQLLIVAGWTTPALVLWLLGVLLWTIIVYAFFTFITVRENKPPIESGLSGVWLIAVVATQSISVLGTLLAGQFLAYRILLLFLTLCLFMVGCMHYLMLITLIFYRFTFVGFTTAALTPPYWINMGAVAISTLAGARLILAAPESALLTAVLPFLQGFTLFFWSAGTWWIPLLVLLGFWRHVYKRFPFRYDPQYWGMVFPLGMYTVCTFQLARAIRFEPLTIVSRYFVFIALAAWLIVFVGMLHSLIGKGPVRALPKRV